MHTMQAGHSWVLARSERWALVRRHVCGLSLVGNLAAAFALMIVLLSGTTQVGWYAIFVCAGVCAVMALLIVERGTARRPAPAGAAHAFGYSAFFSAVVLAVCLPYVA